MEILDAFLTPLRRAFDFSGRSDRPEFWQFFLANMAVVFLLSGLGMVAGNIVATLFSVYGLAVMVPFLSLTIRRLRDAGYNPAWTLLLFTGLFSVVLLILLALPSAPGGDEAVQGGAVERGEITLATVAMTLLAFTCYAALLLWLQVMYSGLVASKHAEQGWFWLAVLPFLALGARHLFTLGSPWPRGIAPVMGVLLFFMLMFAVSHGEFSGLFRKSVEGRSKGDLSALRQKLGALTARTGASPTPEQIRAEIPQPPLLRLPYTPHQASAEIRFSSGTDIRDSGLWYYDGWTFMVDCTHLDSRDKPWSSF